jgi:hypothetical protein
MATALQISSTVLHFENYPRQVRKQRSEKSQLAAAVAAVVVVAVAVVVVVVAVAVEPEELFSRRTVGLENRE